MGGFIKLSHSREATLLIRPLFHLRMGGLIRGEQLYMAIQLKKCLKLWKQILFNKKKNISPVYMHG